MQSRHMQGSQHQQPRHIRPHLTSWGWASPERLALFETCLLGDPQDGHLLSHAPGDGSRAAHLTAA